eukprot:2943985-Amphidinium_carterae.1
MCVRGTERKALRTWGSCPLGGLCTCSAASARCEDPSWFTAHWWGEPVSQFLLCLRQYAALRKLSAKMAYWICAYANNQHDAAGDIGCRTDSGNN